jgi:hypothetical protein
MWLENHAHATDVHGHSSSRGHATVLSAADGYPNRHLSARWLSYRIYIAAAYADTLADHYAWPLAHTFPVSDAVTD